MKNIFTSCLILLLLWGIAPDEIKAQLRILPLGNSITQASGSRNSWRRPLYKSMINAGYQVDFVGSMDRNNSCNSFPSNDFDPDHEGHWGWSAKEILDGRNGGCRGTGRLSQWINQYTADVALIHIGTNDMADGHSISATTNRIGQIIDLLRGDNPDVVVFVAQIIPSNRSQHSRVPDLNAALPGFASNKSTSQSPVIIVDQYSGFNVNSDTYDGVHPNSNGEQKMAARWFEAFDNYFQGGGDTGGDDDNDNGDDNGNDNPPTPEGDIKINFQPFGSTPSGYIGDNGSSYGNRGNGLSYGWLGGPNNNTRNRSGGSNDSRLRTLNHMQKSGSKTWEISLENGNYNLEIACGDSEHSDQINSLNVEGIQVSDPDGEDNFDVYNLTVTVSDGKLTIAPGSGSQNAKICYVDISPVDTNPTFDLTVNNGSGDGSFEAGTNITIVADAAPSGQEFDAWTGNISNVADISSPSTSVTMPGSNVSVTATYKNIVIPTFTLSVNNGSGSGSYEAGEVVTITANTPNICEAFGSWIGDISDVANVNSSTTMITMPASDVTITAELLPTPCPSPYDLTVVNGSGTGQYQPGEVINISANAAPTGQVFDAWTGDISEVANISSATTVLIMPSSDATITATYKDVPTPSGPFAKVNFQPSGSSTPSGYIVDGGSAYGNRGNGFSYGWLGGANNNTRNRSGSNDQRLRTLNHLQKGNARTWEISVPNGDYELEIGCGDPQYSDQINSLDVEGVQVLDSDGEDNIDIFVAIQVTVTDGRLTIKPSSGASNAKINYVDINILSNTPPPPPVEYSLSVDNGSGDGNYTMGAVVSIAANSAPTGQQFAQWTGDISAVSDINSSSTTITMPSANVTLSATYETIPPMNSCASVDIEIEAESSSNTLAGNARLNNKSSASGGTVVGYLGNGSGNYLTINNIDIPCSGDYQVEVSYISGATRTIFLRANSGTSQSETVNSGSWNSVSSFTKTLSLSQGLNSIRFFNNSQIAPDIDKIRIIGTGNARSVQLNEVTRALTLSTSPNPSNGSFSVQVLGLRHPGVLSIHDMKGRKMGSYSLDIEKIEIDDKFHAGVYLIRFKSGNDILTKKIVVK